MDVCSHIIDGVQKRAMVGPDAAVAEGVSREE